MKHDVSNRDYELFHEIMLSLFNARVAPWCSGFVAPWCSG